MKPYPMITTPILKDKVWGGTWLEKFNKDLQGSPNVGESWELADLASTSPDGGGGDAAHSTIANGEARGLTIRDAVNAMGPNLMGDARLMDDGSFPLLVKYLDAAQNLSVQVHPSTDFAQNNPGAHLKTETWYILHAEPDAVIYKGVKPGVTEDQFKQAITDNAVGQLMNAIPVSPGDTHHMPSGICHALGAGVLVAEVQMPSDTTFRVYDWGREGRTLHIDQAMQCISFPGEEPAPAVRGNAVAGERSVLESNEHYKITEVVGNGNSTFDLDTAENSPAVVMFVAGEGHLESHDGSFEPVPYKAGDTALVPAALDGVRVRFDRDTTMLKVRLGS